MSDGTFAAMHIGYSSWHADDAHGACGIGNAEAGRIVDAVRSPLSNTDKMLCREIARMFDAPNAMAVLPVERAAPMVGIREPS